MILSLMLSVLPLLLVPSPLKSVTLLLVSTTYGSLLLGLLVMLLAMVVIKFVPLVAILGSPRILRLLIHSVYNNNLLSPSLLISLPPNPSPLLLKFVILALVLPLINGMLILGVNALPLVLVVPKLVLLTVMVLIILITMLLILSVLLSILLNLSLLLLVTLKPVISMLGKLVNGPSALPVVSTNNKLVLLVVINNRTIKLPLIIPSVPPSQLLLPLNNSAPFLPAPLALGELLVTMVLALKLVMVSAIVK
jgi:hypothetical protein